MVVTGGSEPTAAYGQSNPVVRVVLADDECLFRASLRHLLAVPPPVIKKVYGVDIDAGFEVVGEAGTGEDTIRVVNSVGPDLLLLDLSMPRMSGLEALRELEGRRETMKTIILAGGIDRVHLLAAVHMGVRGLLLKNATTETMFEAIRCVMAGQYWLEQKLVTDLLESVRPLIQSSSAAGGKLSYGLTPRERQVLSMIVAGCSNKEIARAFSVSEQTIKHHLTRMFDKVGASTRVELAMLAARFGLVDPSEPVRCPATGLEAPAMQPCAASTSPATNAIPAESLLVPAAIRV
jgi:two-component system, NarL family, nitrate/nitrite response regulator NarL